MNCLTKVGEGLAGVAFSRLSETLESRGSNLGSSSEEAIRSLLEVMEEALGGSLTDKFYLSSIDPGIGKTWAVCEFLKAWKERSYQPEGGVLIGVSRLEEIQTYVSASGLQSDEFGVLTSSEELNALGAPQSRHGATRVQFTTQQMIMRRTRGRTFSESAEFHYQGRPRSLRVWDESLLPSEPVSFSRDDLGLLLSPFRIAFPAFTASLDSLIASIAEAGVGEAVTIPQALMESVRPSLPNAELSSSQTVVLESLSRMAGRQMVVVDDGGAGRALAGTCDTLPSDFAPVVILDASGRVRATYDLWERQRGNLVRLPAATNDYRQLEVFLWQRPSGRQTLSQADSRREVLHGIAKAINQDDESRWLIVHYKAADSFIEDLRSLVLVGGAQRVEAITWGNHHGTNAFRNTPNIVLVGQMTYRRSGYMAQALAASGLDRPLAGLIAEGDTREGENKHHLLQAVCRASVRKSLGGVAGQCRAFLISSTPQVERVLRETFPGCEIREWNGEAEELNGQVGLAADYLLRQFSNPETQRVRKRDVRQAIGIRHAAAFSSNVIAHTSFRAFMGRNWIEQSGQWFTRVEPFEVVEEGWVYDPEEWAPSGLK